MGTAESVHLDTAKDSTERGARHKQRLARLVWPKIAIVCPIGHHPRPFAIGRALLTLGCNCLCPFDSHALSLISHRVWVSVAAFLRVGVAHGRQEETLFGAWYAAPPGPLPITEPEDAGQRARGLEGHSNTRQRSAIRFVERWPHVSRGSSIPLGTAKPLPHASTNYHLLDVGRIRRKTSAATLPQGGPLPKGTY